MTDLLPGMFVVHKRHGWVGMIVSIHGPSCHIQFSNGGRWWAYRTKSLRAAYQDEIVRAGFAGVGCVDPPEFRSIAR